MARPAMSLATRAKLAAAAADRYARYVESDPFSPAGGYARSAQTVASQHGIGRRQVERYRARRTRLREIEEAAQRDVYVPPVITSEQVETVWLIAELAQGGDDALLIAAVLGIPHEAFAVARVTKGSELPKAREVKLYSELGEWLGEWGNGKPARA